MHHCLTALYAQVAEGEPTVTQLHIGPTCLEPVLTPPVRVVSVESASVHLHLPPHDPVLGLEFKLKYEASYQILPSAVATSFPRSAASSKLNNSAA